jgi:hypothetical protein
MMEKRGLLIGMELYKCLMLTVIALLLLLVTLRAQWTRKNPMPVRVVSERQRSVVEW